MKLIALVGGENNVVSEQLKRIFLATGQFRLVFADNQEELMQCLLTMDAQLAVLPLEWAEIYSRIKDHMPAVRIVAYGKENTECANAILQGADNYYPFSASEERRAEILAFERRAAVRNWQRGAAFFVREKARNQLIYARIKDSFENVALSTINQNFCFRFQNGLFRAILLRVDYESKEQHPFDWFHTFDGTVVMEILTFFHRFCFDVYVEFRMNGPMFYCNYAKEKDNLLFRELERLCAEVLRRATASGELWLTLQVGRAYEDLQSLQVSREEAYHASLIYLKDNNSKILLFGKKEYADLWENKRLAWIYDQLCSAGAKLDVVALDQCVEELRWMSMEQMRSLFARYEKDFFSMNAALIESYANLDHVRKKVIQALNFANSKKSLIETFLAQYHSIIGDILHVAPRGVRVIHMAQQYVADHYAQKICVQDVAERLRLNPSYFSHLFTKETGQHFSDYLMAYRIEKSKEFLMSTNLSVGEVAEKVGYGDQRYFSRVFHRITGANPTEFRRNVPNKDLKL